MERMRERKRLQNRRRVQRLVVTALVYLALLTAAVVGFLGGVWILKHTGYGWLMLMVLCFGIGGWLFFQLAEEGQASSSLIY